MKLGERERFNIQLDDLGAGSPDCNGEERLKGGVEVCLSHLRR